MSNTLFDDKNRFILQNFHRAPCFSSFLPGIAGMDGIPLWVFYVNRGQGIASMGIRDKNSAILEFLPANKAYRLVPVQGFRTFLRYEKNGQKHFYEPFGELPAHEKKTTSMAIGFNELELYETNSTQGFKTGVLYFTAPHENFAGLIRIVTIKNLAHTERQVEILDGLPVIIPYGAHDIFLKNMSNIARAWMEVINCGEQVPYYRVSSSIEDRPDVETYEAGHFFLSFIDNDREKKLLSPFVDPDVIFGQNTSFIYPEPFITGGLDALSEKNQVCRGKYPCGFAGTTQLLEPGKTITLYSIIGHVQHVSIINSRKTGLCSGDYIREKYKQARELISNLTEKSKTKTASHLFDLYVQQTFLDNLLRGGFPVLLPAGDRQIPYYLYSRKHGDLERDYNFFVLKPEYYSQGNGSYRDMNQNRRTDIFFTPAVRHHTLKTFINLIQLDGYNPLVVKGAGFTLASPDIEKLDAFLVNDDQKLSVMNFFKAPYTPGSLLMFLEKSNIALSCTNREFLMNALSCSSVNDEADDGEGFWIDHWTYILDLIDSYSAIYPDCMYNLLFSDDTFTFYDNTHIVLPASEKYVCRDGKIRQYGSVIQSKEKIRMREQRKASPHLVRKNHGRGQIYTTTCMTKLICLFITKFSSLDPDGMGIEMEAGRPGWNDSLNGLPALFGSSVSETWELLRLIRMLTGFCTKYSTEKITIPKEVMEFIEKVSKKYKQHKNDKNNFLYWERVRIIREKYREKIKFGTSGKEVRIRIKSFIPILMMGEEKVKDGLNKASSYTQTLPPTCFTFTPVQWEYTGITTHTGYAGVRIKSFKPEPLPLFLEGVVKAMKGTASIDDAGKIHEQVKQGNLYDRKLHMYKLNESLSEQSFDTGRCRVFTPGWLENESIWLHMEYKYLLELLKKGLHTEFWEEAQQVLVPFLDPAVYGRSIIENSSFIVSSEHIDPSLHGRGFLPRLTGATSEFLHMWWICMAGKSPFTLQNEKLELTLTPSLPAWLFSSDGLISFKFLGATDVIYYNASKRDIFPPLAEPYQINLHTASSKQITLTGWPVTEPLSKDIRNGLIKTIEVFY